jgi:hypothetical protein
MATKVIHSFILLGVLIFTFWFGFLLGGADERVAFVEHCQQVIEGQIHGNPQVATGHQK